MFSSAIPTMRRQHGLITRHQLRGLGVDSRDVRRLIASGELVAVRHGVYVEGDRWADLDQHDGRPRLRIRAAGLSLRSTYVLSHDSAAILLGMGAPDPATALVHVTRPKVHGDAVRAGVKHHLAPYRPDEVVVVDGLRVLAPARTALDLVREHGRVAGLAGCDAALRLGAERHELDATLGRMRCWPHARVMRWCIDHADAGAESYLESRARDLVLQLGIGRPETQLGLSDGVRTVWCDLRVGRHVFEVDGMLKYGPDLKDARDVLLREKRRQDFITGFKLGVSRVTAHDCGPGRREALARLEREYADTVSRFGESVADLAPYVVPRSRRLSAG